jgi:hypothetical protein
MFHFISSSALDLSASISFWVLSSAKKALFLVHRLLSWVLQVGGLCDIGWSIAAAVVHVIVVTVACEVEEEATEEEGVDMRSYSAIAVASIVSSVPLGF